VLVRVARAVAAQLVHLRARAQQQAQVHAHGAHVRARLALHPEDAQAALRVVVEQARRVHGAHAQLPLHGRDERRALEERARQLLERLTRKRLLTFFGKNCVVHLRHPLLLLDRRVQLEDGHVLLAGALLRLHQPRGPVDADDQATSGLNETAYVPEPARLEFACTFGSSVPL